MFPIALPFPIPRAVALLHGQRVVGEDDAAIEEDAPSLCSAATARLLLYASLMRPAVHIATLEVNTTVCFTLLATAMSLIFFAVRLPHETV